MATALKTEVQTSEKALKMNRAQQPLANRVSDQLTKAVLCKKITKGELAKLVAHVTKLEAFIDA
jgi:hypothetical protein